MCQELWSAQDDSEETMEFSCSRKDSGDPGWNAVASTCILNGLEIPSSEKTQRNFGQKRFPFRYQVEIHITRFRHPGTLG